MGDNVTFLWNLWWMRTALATGHDFFHTAALFAPVGADLTLDTNTALPAFVGATALAQVPLIAAENITILVALWLNAWCAYLLAWRITGDAGAAIAGGVVFGGSAYVSAHLLGHFNLINAWTVPLFALAWLAALERGRVGAAVAAGLVLGVTAYVSYYDLVQELALGGGILALTTWDWSLARATTPVRSLVWRRLVATALVVDLGVIGLIASGRDLSLSIDARRILIDGTFNPLQLFWALAAVWVILWIRPRLHVRRAPVVRAAVVWRAALVCLAVGAMVTAPIAWNGARLIARGDYVTQHYFWRSAPPGIDAASFVLGNPFHPLWGAAVQHLYERLGLDRIESGAGWLGLVPMGLAWLAIRRRWSSASVRLWCVVGGLFLVWALGPHLMAFGRATGMILPQTLLRYVPMVSNARIPGRAIVVTDLAVALLAAIALSDWRARTRRPALVLGLAMVGVVADLWPAPFPYVTLDHPVIYDTLRDRPETGAVCEVPLGVRDGFGELGYLDHRVLFYQAIHGRPLVGGFVARLPPSILSAYRDDPLIASLLHFSDRGPMSGSSPPAPDRQAAATWLQRDGIRFVMLNRETASPVLVDYVEHTLPLTLIARDEARSLYLTNEP